MRAITICRRAASTNPTNWLASSIQIFAAHRPAGRRQEAVEARGSRRTAGRPTEAATDYNELTAHSLLTRGPSGSN
jgi:hypothetical protein